MNPFNDVSVAIPWRNDFEDREVIFNWNVNRLQTFAPGAQIVTGDVHSPVFSYSGARNVAIQRTDRKYILLMDADVVVNCDQLVNALALMDHGAPWVIPYRHYAQLTKDGTEELLSLPPHAVRLERAASNHVYPQSGSAGVALFRQEDLITLGGFDERFLGWGYEYSAFLHAARVVLGDPVRCYGAAQHLHHKEPRRESPFLILNKTLHSRYRAIKDPDMMREFIYDGTTL